MERNEKGVLSSKSLLCMRYHNQMQKLTLFLLLGLLIITSCTKRENGALSSFEIYCEMVASDAKPIALHYPMEAKEVDELWEEFAKVAAKYEVKLYREDDFPQTLLFGSALTAGKSVVLIYQGDRLKQYQQWKTDLTKGSSNSEELARRFGRLLGYGAHGINQLLSKNSDFRTLASFKVEKQVTHLYYESLNEAIDFYDKKLGFNKIDSSLFQVSDDAFIYLHPLSEEHPKDQPKSTAIAFLTDQLAEWYEYVQEVNIPIKYTYKPRQGGPHDGFVAIDPGGYLLEFEQFKQHPENELFIATLAQATPIETSVRNLNFYGSITWTYHKDLLQMQKFYEEVLGYQLVADQGWTKIYQTSKTGFIGLVDERRGMEDYAPTKALEIEWQVGEGSGFDTYALQAWQQYSYDNPTLTGPEQYTYRITGK